VDTIEKKRQEMGAVSLYNRDSKYLGGTRADRKIMIRYREPSHVDYAASLGLGVADKERIRIRRVHV
jgi:hypothetical protein